MQYMTCVFVCVCACVCACTCVPVHLCAHVWALIWHLQGYKMDDLLTSYISQMLTTMNRQRSGQGHSKWTSYWQEVTALIQLLRPVGHPCSWRQTFAHQLWQITHSLSASSEGSKLTADSSSTNSNKHCECSSKSCHYHYDLEKDEPSSEDDYLWDLQYQSQTVWPSHMEIKCSVCIIVMLSKVGSMRLEWCSFVLALLCWFHRDITHILCWFAKFS